MEEKRMTREEIETKLKETVVSSLDLEDLTAADIETDVQLFGEGLGLDSIDALELGMAVKKAFGVTFSSDAAENRKVFRSVKTLADFIESQQKA
jgi:acyl carrier protein